MDAIAALVLETFVAAYPDLLRDRVAALHPEPVPGLDEALAAGGEWLSEHLADLLSQPFREQAGSPLEVFREAVRFPTEALQRSEVPAPERDEAARSGLPGDLYDLAPASSRDLGEAAWRAHLAWGTAKAKALARPVVGVLAADLMDRSRIEAAARSAGYTAAMWADVAAVREASGAGLPASAFVDLEHRDADGVIRLLAAAGVRVVGFGPHVDDFALVRARTLGARDAMARSRFFRVIGDLLPPMV